MSGYIGTQPVPQTTQTRDSFTATSNQTSFPTSGYTPNYLDVFLNGVKLAAADYTATNNSDVVLAVGAATGDILEVVAYSTFNAANVTGAVDFTVTGDITVNGTVDGVDIAARDAVLTSTTTTAGAALPKAGGALTGAVTTNSTFDGVDIATRDAVLTATTTTANAALPKAGGALTGEVTTTNVFKAHSSSSGDYVRMYGGSGTGKWDIYGNGANLRIGDNESAGIVTIDTALNVGGTVTAGGTLTTGAIASTAVDGTVLDRSGNTSRFVAGRAGGNYAALEMHVAGASGVTKRFSIDYDSTTKLFAPNGTSEHLVVTSAGNLLVGTTSSNYGVVGSQIGTGGNNYMTRSGAQPLLLNRLSSDGDILLLMKDGSTVGSIGVVNANNMYLSGSASNHAGVQFGTQNVTPYNNGSQSDGAVDLGASNLRWKDAYFSGGVTSSKPQGGTAFHASTAGSYIQVDGSSSSAMAFGMTGGNGSPATAASTSLGFHHWNNSSWANPVNITRDGIAFNGDTAAANALNDYEEGTWTATGNGITLADQVCSYVKVGNIVHIGAKVVFPTTSSTGNSSITLPFASVNSQASRSGISIGFHTAGSSYYGLQFLVSTDAADGVFYIGSTLITNANLSGKTVFFGGTYLSDN